MKVPTTDYSPLMRANAERSQAKRTQFVAPNIDYQSKSLALKKRGLESDLSYLRSQETLGSLKFINSSLTGLIAGGLGAMEAKQAQEAQAMGHQQATDFQTFLAEGFANGDFYYEVQEVDGIDGGGQHLRLVGADKIQAFQNQQVEAMKAQGWMKGVQDQAISSMQNFYSGMQGKMAQDFWAKETADKFKLEQMNLNTAIEGDTADWLQTDYQRTDSFISGLQGYSPSAKAAMTASAHSQIDLGRAANQVRNTAASQGSAAGVAQANAISDQRNYTPDTRNRLIGYANQAAGQAKAAALAQGTQFMEQAIQGAEANGMTPDFAAIYDQARDNAKGMSDEAGKVYMDAVEQGHLEYLTNVFNENTRDDPETMGNAELEEKIASLEELKPMFDATPATRKLYANMVAAYKKEDKASKAEDKDNRDYYVKSQKAILKTLVPTFMAGEITASELMDNVKTIMAGAEAVRGWIGDDNAYDIATIGMDIINSLDSKIETKNKGGFDTLKKTISDDAKAWYKVEKDSELSDEQKQEILTNQIWAEAALLEVLRQNPALSDEEVNKKVQEITALYKVKNIETLSGPITVSTRTYKEEVAMNRTAGFQDYEAGFAFFDSKDKKLKLNPKFEKEYDNAALIERDMLRENYGIDVKDEYTIMRYGDKMVPMFEDKDNLKYIVMDGKVYQWYKNGQIAEKPQQKPFVSEGYEEIPGLTRHLMGDANAFNDAGSKESREKLYGYLR